MKNSTLVLSLLFLLVSSFMAHAIDCENPQNKLKNGSFEQRESIGLIFPFFRVTDWNTDGWALFTREQGNEECGNYYGLLTNLDIPIIFGNPYVKIYQDVPLTDDVTSVTLTIWAGKIWNCNADIRLVFLDSNGDEISGSTKTVVVTQIVTLSDGLAEYTLTGSVPAGAKTVRVECRTQKTLDKIAPFLKVDGAVLLFETETTLPVELASLSATMVEDIVEVSWQTASEENTGRFEVQHSSNGSSWNTLTEIKAAGNHAGLLTYRFVHTAPSHGINYYRLKTVDLDGTFEYSKIVNVVYGRADLNAYLYPNPSAGLINFGTASARDVVVLDLRGNPVVKRNAVTDKLDLSALRSGIYMVSWTDEINQKHTQRLVISR